MTERTAFPNVWVESIEVETPPYDSEGEIQGAVGRGVTREFDALVSATDMTAGRISDFLEGAEEMIPMTRDQSKLTYNLVIRAVPNPGMGPFQRYMQHWQERSAAGRARAFVRAKNPFEPDVIEVDDPVIDTRTSGEDVGTFYSVDASVLK